MRRGWRLALGAALVLAFLVGATAKAGGEGKLVLERTSSMGAGGTVWLETGRGGVHVLGDSRGDVHIEVRAEGMDVEDARDRLELELREVSGGLEVRVEIDEPFSLFGRNDRGRIWVEVHVPHRTNLEVDNGSGGVRVQDLDGNVQVDNGSGGVKLLGITGRVEVDNGSGGVGIESVQGDVRVDNGSGGIRLEDIQGDVSVDNSSGGVSVSGVDGRLEIDNGSGGVKAELSGRNRGVEVASSSGGVVLKVPRDWGAELDLESRSGHLSVRGFSGLELEGVEQYRGNVGGGGPVITVRGGSGSVLLVGS